MVSPAVDLARCLETVPSCRLLHPHALFLGQACCLGELGVQGEPRRDAGVLKELLARSNA